MQEDCAAKTTDQQAFKRIAGARANPRLSVFIRGS